MAIQIRNLSHSFGGQPVIRNFSCDFPERGVVALTGRSGVGKTTLLNIMLGLIQPDAGRVTGVPRVGAVFQDDRLIEDMSVLNNLRLVCDDTATIERHLMDIGLYESRHDAASSLSGGMRRRVAVARAVLHRCDAVLMDEPFKGLDAETRAQVAGYALRECADRLIVLVSHEPEEIRLMGAEQIIEIREVTA